VKPFASASGTKRPLPDLDAVILMATTLSSKRRAAELVEIVAAADLIQGFIPFAQKLGAALERLSGTGLIGHSEDGFTLTAAGHGIMAKQPKKGANEDLIAALSDDLARYRPREECPPVLLSPEQLDAAIRAHKASRKAGGKNLLMPKPKVVSHFKVEGRWRRAVPKR
jgi:hypothetical protein